jgi:hypothetical protein
MSTEEILAMRGQCILAKIERIARVGAVYVYVCSYSFSLFFYIFLLLLFIFILIFILFLQKERY